jgi:hypothetical protein
MAERLPLLQTLCHPPLPGGRTVGKASVTRRTVAEKGS